MTVRELREKLFSIENQESEVVIVDNSDWLDITSVYEAPDYSENDGKNIVIIRTRG